MKVLQYILSAAIFLSVLSFSQNVFSWGLFNLFTDQTFSKSGLESVERFNPDEDILYLPKLKDKDIFTSMEDLSICRKREVRKFIYTYLTTGRKYSKEAIERSHLYYDIISDIFKQNSDIPFDISLLPLLESGFNPYAVSRSRAVGLWQFIATTSKHLGLRKDRWIDERRDIEKSTHAAIRHLRHLYEMFNSWELALAAYNGGAMHVIRSMKKAGTRNFWELTRSGMLNTETREYVPRFIALALIYKNQRLFGIYDEINTPHKEKTDNFILKYPTHIQHILKVSGISEEVIRTYNPELKKKIVPPYYKNYTLRVPAEVIEKLEEKEKELYKNRFTRVKKHKVQQGECLSLIARHYKKKQKPLLFLTA